MRGEPLSEATCELPGGLALEDGRVLCQAELRPLSGSEELWLAEHPALPGALAVSHLLLACLARLDGQAPDRELVERLLVADRDYLIWQLRRLMLGDYVPAVMACPACGSQMDLEFSAGEIPAVRHRQTAASFTHHCADGGTVRFRLPTGADQAAVLGLADEEAVQALLARCLLDGSTADLAPAEQTALIAEMERLAPHFDLELDLTCPECGHAFVAPFDTSVFFVSEIKAHSRQLLYEVHTLALYYHWSQAEILSLTRERRRTYISMLSDALRKD